MKTRILNGTGLALSSIGLGTWALGEEGYRKGIDPKDDRDSIGTILTAIERGINWIDTAPSYGFGYSEAVIGKAIKASGKRPIVSTKCGLVGDKGRLHIRLDKKSMRSEIEATIKRLGIDAIDMYQIHRPASDEETGRAWETMAEFAEEKKIRYAGVSNFSVEQIERIRRIRPVDFVQAHYSMLSRNIEKDLLAYCAKNGIGVVTYSPIERGLLAGKFSWKNMNKLGKHDHRRKNPLFAEKSNFELVEQLRPVAARNNMSMSQLAIAWILRRPEITSVIAGARLPSQIEETALSADLPILKKDLEEIEIVLKKKDS